VDQLVHRAARFAGIAAGLGCTTTGFAQQAELPHARSDATGAATGAGAAPDRFTLLARSETYLQLFRRALLPGPAGSVVTSEALAPLTEYLRVEARDADSPWQRDSVDVELSAWQQVWPTRSGYERPFDGDLQTANLGLSAGPVRLRLGRQLMAGGAARFARFDGLSLSAPLGAGLSVAAYGGWAVLPRWDARPGYHQLGIAERGALPGEALTLPREAHWLVGGRAVYTTERASAAVSFHEQHAVGGVQRRNLGLDASAQLFKTAAAGGSVLYELDQRHVAEARAHLDLAPLNEVRLTVEGVRTKPGLFLSRQSVLSVFGTSAYDELGGFLSWQVLNPLRLETSGWVERYDTGRPGARSEAVVRLDLGGARPTLVRTGYGRVLVAGSGYHTLRLSLARALAPALTASVEAYSYFYDRALWGYRTSALYSGTLSYRPWEALELLWGGSLFSSPYARLDAQTLLRVSYELDASGRGRRR
jgi:hypothetical protein